MRRFSANQQNRTSVPCSVRIRFQAQRQNQPRSDVTVQTAISGVHRHSASRLRTNTRHRNTDWTGQPRASQKTFRYMLKNCIPATDRDRLCGLVVRVLGYRSGGPGSIPGTTKKNIMGLERGPLSLVSTTEELLDRKVAAPV
jgi:hypothetical protein